MCLRRHLFDLLKLYLVKSYLPYLPPLILHIIPHVPAPLRDKMSPDDLIGAARTSFQVQGHAPLFIHLQLLAQVGRVYIIPSSRNLSWTTRFAFSFLFFLKKRHRFGKDSCPGHIVGDRVWQTRHWIFFQNKQIDRSVRSAGSSAVLYTLIATAVLSAIIIAHCLIFAIVFIKYLYFLWDPHISSIYIRLLVFSLGFVYNKVCEKFHELLYIFMGCGI